MSDPSPETLDLDALEKLLGLDRCDYCGWPLKDSPKEGCTEDGCSMRPRPVRPTDHLNERFAMRALLREIRELREKVRKLEHPTGLEWSMEQHD